MIRQIVLDTETTGMRVEDGNRIIEIGCLEMIDRKLTGNRYHTYINPQREIEAGALAVHGISNEFLNDKPVFADIAKDMMDFINGAELIIHNAPFDVSYLNNELMLLKQTWKTIADYCRVVDTLQMARRLHVGQRNSLDALCKRYSVDNSKRDLHGALIDCHLLAQVYLAMTGGQGSFFETMSATPSANTKSTEAATVTAITQHNLMILEANADELSEHEKYLQMLAKKGKCVWEAS